MKYLGRRLIGAAVLVLGLLLVFNVVTVTTFGRLLSTVVYPAKFWYQQFPSGTQANPTMLTPASTIQVSALLVYFDVQTGIQLPGTYLTWSLTATVTDANGATVATINVEATGNCVPSLDNRYAAFEFKTSWTVPNVGTQSYTFSWLAVIRDENYNQVGSATSTTYAATSSIQPDGVFTINGQSASQTSKLIVLSPTLTLGFAPIKNPDKITGVNVQVLQGGSLTSTVALVKQASGNYTASYTLPNYGTYQMNGFIEWTGGAQIQKMSLITQWNNPGGGGGFAITMSQILGLVFVAIGAVLAAKPSLTSPSWKGYLVVCIGIVVFLTAVYFAIHAVA